MLDKILTLEEAKERGLDFFLYPRGVYKYLTEDSPHLHLIREGVDLLKDKKAVVCRSFENGDYSYRTEGSPHYRLIRDDVDLLKGKKAIYCFSYKNGDYDYQTEDGEWHEAKKDGKTPVLSQRILNTS